MRIVIPMMVAFSAVLAFLLVQQDSGARIATAGPNCDANVQIDAQEEAFLDFINIYRAYGGIGPLVFSDTLNQAASWKSEHMAANDYLGHDDAGIGRDFVARLCDCGYTADTSLAENVAAGNDTAEETFEQWRLSTVHNSNMLDPNLVAIGIARAFDAESEFRGYWATEFGGVADGYAPSRRLFWGDTNCDGAANALDATLILQLSAGIIATLPCPGGGDTNGDGITDPLDATLVLQLSAGLIGALPF